MIEYLDEEGLLKVMQLSELSLKISKLTFNWNNFSDPNKEAHELMNMVRKFSLDISEYEQRMGSKLSEDQRNIIYNSMEDLEKLIPYMKNKIKPNEITTR
jgi:undecaprenyl pyrophosphate synthase